MDAETRDVVAFIIWQAAYNETPQYRYDPIQPAQGKMMGVVNSGDILIESEESGVRIMSRSRGSGLLLYQMTGGYHIDLEIENFKFKGYDEESGAHFSGTITPNLIWFFDYEEAEHFRYEF